jgi:hypothetical protein
VRSPILFGLQSEDSRIYERKRDNDESLQPYDSIIKPAIEIDLLLASDLGEIKLQMRLHIYIDPDFVNQRKEMKDTKGSYSINDDSEKGIVVPVHKNSL